VVEKKATDLPGDALAGKSWRLMSTSEQEILEKMERISIPLKAWLGPVEIRRGVLTGFNEAFFIDEATRARLIAEDPKSAELIKPLIIGEDVKRYEIEFKGRYLIFTRHGTPIAQYPAIEAHLKKFKKELLPRPPDWDEEKQGKWPGRKPGGYEWYEIQDTIDYYRDFERPKIMYANICKQPEFALDRDNFFSNQKTFIIPTDDLFLIALLNSSVTFFLFRAILPKLRGDYFEPSYVFMKDFPIRRISFTTPKEERARLVEEGKRLYLEALERLGLGGDRGEDHENRASSGDP
jgi:hypothetical protein